MLHLNSLILSQIQRQSPRRINALIPHDTHQRLTILKQTGLETDDHKLHARARMIPHIRRQTRGVRIVERGVDLVEDEEWARRVCVDGKEECEGGHCFFAAGEVLHVAEALQWGHGVVFDTREVGFVVIF